MIHERGNRYLNKEIQGVLGGFRRNGTRNPDAPFAKNR